MMKLYMSSSNFSYNNGDSQSESEIFNYNNGKGTYQRFKNNNLVESKTFNKKQLKKNNVNSLSNRYKIYDLKTKDRYDIYRLTGGNVNDILVAGDINNKEMINNDIEPGLDLNKTSFSKNIIRLTPK